MTATANDLRLLRVSRRLRVVDIAREMQVDPSLVSHLESGRRTLSDRAVRRYLDALNAAATGR